MSILTLGGLPETDRLGNPIYPSFRNMIRLEELYADEELTDYERVLGGIQLLYGPEIPCGIEDAANELIWFYYCGKPPESTGRGGRRGARIYDFEEDADCIYSAFLSAYGIDLVSTSLHWWEFMALFTTLPENTQMAQRMYYRGLDTSKLKGSWKKECEVRKKAFALKRKTNPVVRGLSREEIDRRTKERVDRRFKEAERQLRERKGQP